MLKDINQIFKRIENRLDIVFANEQEILSFIDGKSFDEVISFSKELNKNIITKEKKDLFP